VSLESGPRPNPTDPSQRHSADQTRAAGQPVDDVSRPGPTRQGRPGPELSIVPPAQTEYLNRHLSWLDFNERVLAIAEDTALPILERVKFLAIFAANLDEFFQVRVADLDEQVGAGIVVLSPDGLSPSDQLQLVRNRSSQLAARHQRVFLDEVAPQLDRAGVRIVDWDTLEEEAKKFLAEVFEGSIFPVLTPLSVDPAHPFPYISNLSLNLAVAVRNPQTLVRRFARVKVPPLLPRFVALPEGERFVPLEQVIAAHLGSLFPGMDIVDHHVFRLTRNQDPDLEEDETMDLRAAVQAVLLERRRSQHAVRLEVDGTMPEETRDLLVRELDLELADVYVVEGPLDLTGLWALYDLDRPDLKEEPWTPVTQRRLGAPGHTPPDLFRVLSQGDVLVQHPYDSFATSVESFIHQAASDPAVLAIKQTLYRTSGGESGIVRSLIRAAESGKQVVALVELTARFEEEANIGWASALEKAGVHVVYGVVGLKTHAKVSMVVRREPAGIRRYCHVGTGNYNSTTATVYEDIGLMSADPDLGADVADLFNYLTGYSGKRKYRRLLVAPLTLRSALTELIRTEAAQPDARIVMKINGLVDPELTDELYRAAQGGAQVDLLVRGICCLRPGVPGLSEGIRVRSIVGRYLEHSRIFRFGDGGRATKYYIGSADLMPRNLDHRVEALAPVTDPELRARLDEILEVCLDRDAPAWELGSDGVWSRVGSQEGPTVHERLQSLAVGRGRPRAVASTQ
jgi:polyphosphate kinase